MSGMTLEVARPARFGTAAAIAAVAVGALLLTAAGRPPAANAGPATGPAEPPAGTPSTPATRPGDADGFVPIFDGRTLAGWRAPDMSFWRVEDGAITGEVTADHKPKENVFLVWQGDAAAPAAQAVAPAAAGAAATAPAAGAVLGDFELTFRFRVFGAEANSGMQFRSEVTDRGLVRGYQADIDGAGKFAAGIWDEYGPRKSLAARGERVRWGADGKRTVVGTFPDPFGPGPADLTRWTEYHLVAKGDTVVLRVDGKPACEFTDQDATRRRLAGVLAVPVIPKPMKVQYKELRLKRL
jgi:hypothetical protein